MQAQSISSYSQLYITWAGLREFACRLKTSFDVPAESYDHKYAHKMSCVSNQQNFWMAHRLITLAKLAEMLNGVGDQSKLDPNRQPICLLLGGGMAAGKSTVRRIIGEAEFWTRVRTCVHFELLVVCDLDRSDLTADACIPHCINARNRISICANLLPKSCVSLKSSSGRGLA